MSQAGHALVVAPAGPIAADILNPGLDALKRMDIPVQWPGQDWMDLLLRREGYLAGSDAERVAMLRRAIALNPRGIWMARGGYGCVRTLDEAGPLLQGPPVPLWGFSDGTALLAAWDRAGWPAWHAPPVSQLPRLDQDSQQRVYAAWHHQEVAPFLRLNTVVSGSVTAPLAGGNLTVLASLAGTPYAAGLRGRIVILEDVGEVAYRVDRLVKQLLLGGGLDEAAGLVLGDFMDIADDERDAIRRHFRSLGPELRVPMVEGLPVGHGPRNAPLPMGGSGGWLATLNAPQGQDASLRLERTDP